MKKILFIILACSLLVCIAGLCTADETFTLSTPVSVEDQATGGRITGYTIIPGPNPRFVINFVWTDASGNEVGKPQSKTWQGADFTDLFGGGLGVTLQERVHDKPVQESL